MSGHYATLLRGTVETFMQTHDVYITDWVDARMVPLSLGHFRSRRLLDYVIEMCEFLERRGRPAVPPARGLPALRPGAGGDGADGGREQARMFRRR